MNHLPPRATNPVAEMYERRHAGLGAQARGGPSAEQALAQAVAGYTNWQDAPQDEINILFNAGDAIPGIVDGKVFLGQWRLPLNKLPPQLVPGVPGSHGGGSGSWSETFLVDVRLFKTKSHLFASILSLPHDKWFYGRVGQQHVVIEPIRMAGAPDGVGAMAPGGSSATRQQFLAATHGCSDWQELAHEAIEPFEQKHGKLIKLFDSYVSFGDLQSFGLLHAMQGFNRFGPLPQSYDRMRLALWGAKDGSLALFVILAIHSEDDGRFVVLSCDPRRVVVPVRFP